MGRNAYKYFGVFLILFFSILFPKSVGAATNIYYSVGQNVSDHKTGSPTITISGTTATFSVAQTATNMGIGDVITYGGQRVFISGKQSTSIWNVITATGTVPIATTTATVTSIAHAFASIAQAFGQYYAASATTTDFLNTNNLVTADYILHIPLYYDTGRDIGNGTNIQQIITGPDNYIRIYTPTSTTSEVNTSQRHSGSWDNTKVYLECTASCGVGMLDTRVQHIRIDGLQIKGGYAPIYARSYDSSLPLTMHISNSIIEGVSNYGNITFSAIGGTGTALRQVYVWNNIIYNGQRGIVFGSNSIGGLSYFYNNTFYNLSVAAVNGAANTAVFKNNLFASSTVFFSNATVAAGSNYNSTASTTLGYAVSGGGNANDRLNQTLTFVDVNLGDFHITSGATGALDVGENLSADGNLSFNTDIDGEPRPYNVTWDIGADEDQGVDDAPPNLSAGLPSNTIAQGNVSTSISLVTNENASCKYATTTGTAYAAMTDTFSTTGGTTHSTTVTGLSDGRRFHYYIKCQDGSSNASTDDYEISFWVSALPGGIWYAESCSVSHTNQALAVTNAGDTLQIPSGTCTGYSSSAGLGVNKAITVRGAGIDSTILQIADNSGTWNSAAFPITAAATIENLTIQTGTVNSGTAFAIGANGVRITGLKYLNQAATTNGYFVVSNGFYGLIDKNDITGGAGNNELIFSRAPTDSWQTPDSLGEKNNLYIENNIFRGAGYVNDCNSNGRCVVRNNVVTAAMKVDGHGLASNSPARGVRHMEVYNNTWTLSGTQTTMELRGGTGMVFNNIGTNSGLRLHEYCATATWANCGGVILTVADYPITDQIGVGMDPKVAGSEPMYLWLNRNSGSIWQISLGYGNDALLSPIIVANRDYYNEVSSFDGTSGVGSGLLSARPATCTAGVGYWATDQGSNWDITNGTANDGMLYKCTATNTWTANYIPYAYPHSLTATSTTGTHEVDTGMGARMFGDGKFYGIATTTPSGTFADISITPGTTADGWVDVAITTWENTGTRQKVWTESIPTLKSTTTVHVIGDLAANESYGVSVDGLLGDSITGDDCSGGICTSDNNGRITFTYSGGYSDHEFEVIQTSPDTTDPIISSVASSTSSTAATVTWTTNELADSKVSYGTAAGTYTTSTSSTSLVTSHNIGLTNLSASTLYYFVVVSADSSGNVSTSTENTLRTTATPDSTPPSRSSGSPSGAQAAGTTQVTIALTTDESATCKYGTTANTAYAAIANTFTTTGGTSHTQTITSLSNGTTYTYYARCTDGSNANSDDYVISFSVSSAAVVSSGGGGGGGGGGSAPYPRTPEGGFRFTATTTPEHKLKLSFHFGDDVTQIIISEKSDFRSTVYIGATTTIEWQRPIGNSIFVKFCNRYGNCSDTLTQTLASSTVLFVLPPPLPVASTTISFRYTFTRDLTLGARGEDVRELQKLLNAQNFPVSLTGPGSFGNETDFFGPATKAALITYQIAKKISPAIGYFGQLTRTSMGTGGVSAQNQTSPPKIERPLPTTKPVFIFTRDLGLGSVGDDVKMLQQFLNSQGFTIAANGYGSLGNETTLFGNRTQIQLIQFQKANNIFPAVGFFGPLTRATIMKLLQN